MDTADTTHLLRYCAFCREDHRWRGTQCLDTCRKRLGGFAKTPGMKRADIKRQEGRAHLARVRRVLLKVSPYCAACRCKVSGADSDLDHITPLAAGGTNDRGNLQLLCKPCHKKKTRQDAARGSKIAAARRAKESAAS